MPNWILIVSTVFSGFLITGGAFLFPYASSFFGVVDYRNATGRGKLIVTLIKLFPVTSILALYFAWTSLSYLALVPFLHFMLVYSIRENKNLAQGPQSQFETESENLESVTTIVEVSWQEWEELKSSKNFLLTTFFAPNGAQETNLLKEIKASGLKLLSSESSNSFKNGTVLLDLEVLVDSFERNKVDGVIKELVSIAWKTQCELRHVDLFAVEQ